MLPLPNRSDPVQKLVFELGKLPGIGEKTATRLAHFILRQDPSYAHALSDALLRARSQTRFCTTCYTFTEKSQCRICEDTGRDQTLICVVERPSDVSAIENTTSFRGTYHVLHGVLSPLDGIGPEELKIRELLQRIEGNRERGVPVQEVILATNPSVEGEATAIYLSKLLRPLEIKTTKLASGLPIGGRLEFSDRQTISKALENRLEIHST